MKSRYDYCIHLVDNRWYVGESTEDSAVWVRKPTAYEKELGFDEIRGFSIKNLNDAGFEKRSRALEFAHKLGYEKR